MDERKREREGVGGGGGVCVKRRAEKARPELDVVNLVKRSSYT